MAWPGPGQTVASTQTSFAGKQKPMQRGQTAKKALNASIGPNRRLIGGGGMAVGPLRDSRGVGIHPKAARTTLLAGMKG